MKLDKLALLAVIAIAVDFICTVKGENSEIVEIKHEITFNFNLNLNFIFWL